MIIKEVEARSIINSNGDESLEICLNKKFVGSSGLDRFNRLAVEQLPTSGDIVQKFNTEISSLLKGMNVSEFRDMYEVEAVLYDLDNSKKYKNIGGATLVALESALIKGMANQKNLFEFINPYADQLPVLISSCVGRGLGYNSKSDIELKEFLIVPGFQNFEENLLIQKLVNRKLGERLKFKLRNYNGAWISNRDWDKVLYSMKYLLEDLSKEFDSEIKLGLNFAANSLFDGKSYVYKNQIISRNDQINLVNKLVREFDLEYIEDPLEDNDFAAFTNFKRGFVNANSCLASNCARFELLKKYVNSIVVKLSQTGSLIKAKELIDSAKENGINVVLSESSSESNDNIFSHLAVAWNVPYVKLGIFGKERLGKINEFKQIGMSIK